ncbi:LuxR C-terminal-related transcriptional regulator [Agromyces sp. SYSU K20354]|uniref:helix-turn-helix transcriptional regulator n=1 Tax=Agromyces cavernae TaxID=2898659 RepID=UPI001E3FDAF1|nr:LuxR C-terminal-related transcriptional regulator [Agromyces cavernae]MCD2443641.1 LuxR C-terminal-related transcriptional regulator [Agromyces cavernae]
MTSDDVLEHGLEAFARQRWREAFDALTEADAEADAEFGADLLDRLATAAILIGDESGIDTATRAHEAYLRAGDDAGAARTAVWIGMHLMDEHEIARAGGWIARAQRIVASGGDAESVGGLLLIPQALGALYGGDPSSALEILSQALELAERFDDHDAIALARMGIGQVEIAQGDSDAGFTLFDEVMVAVTAGELSPVPSGIAYCEVIGMCQIAFDFARAREWTVAFDRWCSAQPDMVAFSGQCQAQRAALFRLHGAWQEAARAATAALARLRRGDRDAAYGAWYEQGEIQRLRGEVEAAEESYRHASETGYPPEPGLALLRLAQGRARSAQSTLHEAMASADVANRRRLLPALIETELAMHDIASARRSVDELIAMTPSAPKPMLRAVVDGAEGAVLLEEGAAREALERLRRAWATWHELDVPYEAARCRVLAALACRALGDEASAAMEFDAARTAFAELGAAPDLARLDALARSIAHAAFGPLTAREVEVVRLVAAGKTNRAIASELYLSEKTVAHHLSNVFVKLGLASRAALTAYAYEHAIV